MCRQYSPMQPCFHLFSPASEQTAFSLQCTSGARLRIRPGELRYYACKYTRESTLKCFCKYCIFDWKQFSQPNQLYQERWNTLALANISLRRHLLFYCCHFPSAPFYAETNGPSPTVVCTSSSSGVCGDCSGLSAT